jgi:hypothetical protein
VVGCRVRYSTARVATIEPIFISVPEFFYFSGRFWSGEKEGGSPAGRIASSKTMSPRGKPQLRDVARPCAKRNGPPRRTAHGTQPLVARSFRCVERPVSGGVAEHVVDSRAAAAERLCDSAGSHVLAPQLTYLSSVNAWRAAIVDASCSVAVSAAPSARSARTMSCRSPTERARRSIQVTIRVSPGG